MRKTVSPRLLLRRSGVGLLVLVIMMSLLIVMTTNVFAGSVNVYDFANVLSKSQVTSEASSLPYAMDIYTTNTFTGSQQQFASETDGKINQNNKVVMAIDVRNHYVYLDGRGVSLSRSQYQDAANAFSSSYRSNPDYNGATVAAIDSLRGNSNSGNTGISGYAPGGNSFGLGALCCIGLLVLAGLAVFGIVRGRRRGVGFFNRGFNRGSVAPPYNQYNQGPYPPNYQGPYPPNYGPGYPNYNQGMNPLAAGGLGAAAGGFLGYELGKEQGERQEREEDGFNQGGNYGGDGGAGSNFGGDNNGGGGAGADFGGGNNGGGDWGGGGGGSDFGGGGGGGDNGGGAGSNF
jgi:hypothetical protein